jgi:hypothetical protein
MVGGTRRLDRNLFLRRGVFLRGERHIRVALSADEPLVHGLEASAYSKGKRRCARLLTFALEAGEGHHFPLFDEEVVAEFAGFTDAFELETHEVAFCVGNALAEGSFDVDGEAFGAPDLCFHGCCAGGVLA